MGRRREASSSSGCRCWFRTNGRPAARGSDENGTAPIAVHQRKVLIVDDHDEVRKSLARIVRTFGHEVVVAKDGPSALALAERFQPDCAILDISMPGMNGIELGRQLRAVFPRERLL